MLPDWWAVVAQVDAVRAEAYRSGSAEPLRSAFLPDGPALAEEEGRVAAIRAGGLSVTGWHTEVLAASISEAPDGTDRAVIRVRDRRGAYEVTEQGAAPELVPASEVRDWHVTFRLLHGRWLVEEVAVANY